MSSTLIDRCRRTCWRNTRSSSGWKCTSSSEPAPRSSAAARPVSARHPNTNVCPVCLGLPGALPVLSREAVEMAIRPALALNCQVRTDLAIRAEELLLSRSAEGLSDLAVRSAAGRAWICRYRPWTATQSASASPAFTWRMMPARASTTGFAIRTATPTWI